LRIGYPCINRSIGCKSDSTFRLKSYSDERLAVTVARNLDCLHQILEFNRDHAILFFRISSDIVPFASHPVCRFDWQSYFQTQLKYIGDLAIESGMRMTMHPDQFILLNSPDKGVHERSIRELEYHCRLMDRMGFDRSCKVQIHVGGVYGDKTGSMRRFVKRFRALDPSISRRIVIENDERLFGLEDCLSVHEEVGVPVVLDTLHYALFNNGDPLISAVRRAAATWMKDDGLPIVDFSLQDEQGRKGRHALTIVPSEFRTFLLQTTSIDFDIMLEIKDKERSAIEAIRIARKDPRFMKPVTRCGKVTER
jgi:UV DNA damage endonuclease